MSSLRRRLIALGAALAVALSGLTAYAVESPSGSRNFTAPGYVPNYFSNESGSFNGGAAARALQRMPAFAAPAPPHLGYATASRREGAHHRRHAAFGRHHHSMHAGAAAHRRFVHRVAARHYGASAAHARPAAHERLARSHARSAASGARRIARAGR